MATGDPKIGSALQPEGGGNSGNAGGYLSETTLTLRPPVSMSQTVISLQKLKFSKQVRAVTEYGALMAANILNSPREVTMSVYVIRARHFKRCGREMSHIWTCRQGSACTR